METKEVSIAVADIFTRIRVEVEYIGAKKLKEDPESYRRIAMIPGDAQLTGGYIRDAINEIVLTLREYEAAADLPLTMTDPFGVETNKQTFIPKPTDPDPPATTMPIDPEIKPTTPTKPTDPEEPEETLDSPKQPVAAGQEITPMSDTDTDTDTDSGSETDTEPTDEEEAAEAVLTLKFSTQDNQRLNESAFKRDVTEYIVCSTVGRWLEITEPKESERYVPRIEQHLDSLTRLMYHRVRPTRPEPLNDEPKEPEEDELQQD